VIKKCYVDNFQTDVAKPQIRINSITSNEHVGPIDELDWTLKWYAHGCG